MKLLRLHMQALGPFAGEQEVDFSALHGASLVLINGPTGSGKTTILDAVCLALYGESSGSTREASSMRCDYAEAGRLTQVTLDFQLGEAVYRVHRVPSQRRPKKKAKGTTQQSHEAFLYTRGDLVASETKDGRLLESGAKLVDQRVQELIGLDIEQFRHVIMLPQGMFRRFLEASSSKREEVLHSLFDTARFGRVAKILGDQARNLHAQLKEATSAAGTLLELTDAQDVEDLVASVEQLAGVWEAAKADEPKRLEALNQARATLHAAQVSAAKFKELELATAQAQQVKARQRELAVVRERVSLMQRAAPLHEAHLAARQREREAKEQTQEHALARRALTELEHQATRTREALAAANAHKPELEALRARAAELATLDTPVREWTQGRLALQSLARAYTHASERSLKATQALDAMQRTGAELEAVIAAATELAGAAEAREQTHVQLLAQRSRFVELRDADLRSQELQTKAEAANRALARAKAALLDAQEALRGEERAWRAGQAGVLAQALEAGAPCPVCGSAAHPRPAPLADGVPSQEGLEGNKAQVLACEELREHARVQCSDIEAQLAQLQGQRDSLREALGELVALDLETFDIRLSHAERAWVESQRAREHVASAKSEATQIEDKLVALAQAQARAQQAEQLAREEQLAAEAALKVLTQAVPEELRSADALHAQLKQVSAHAGRLEAELTQAGDAAKQAAAQLEAHAANLKDAARRELEANERARAASDALDERRKQAGLQDESAWKAAVADIDRGQALATKLAEWDADARASELRLARARTQTKGLDVPALAQLSEAVDLADAAYTQAVKANATHAQAHSDKVGLLDDYRKRSAETASLRDRWELVASIADVAEGKTTRVGAKVSFQRFVLAVYLDEVLLSASGRLQKMSEGRYTLRRRVEAGRKSAAAGLELEVRDAYTGKARDVSTLSGGEGFLTSLALSLALADIATAQAGGIHLDTLFIDEGFGTLDPDALEQALEVLAQLNRGGRMVALISHVPELRRRISTRIEVKVTAAGSRAHLVLGD